MKKYVKFVSVVLLLILIFFTFTSCGGVKYGYLLLLPNELRAASILEIINTRIEEADSYMLTAKTKIDGMVGDLDVTSESIVVEKFSGLNSVHPMKISRGSYEYDYFYDQRDLKVDIIEGYQYGQFYRHVTTDGGFESKLTSPATKEEFEEYNDAMLSEGVVINPEIDKVTSKREMDGSWVVSATITDLTGIKDIDDFESMTTGYKVSALEINITAKKDFSEWETRIDLIFEKIEGYNARITDRYTASVEMVSTYSNFNSINVEKQDLSDYCICSDLRLISKISNQLDDKLDIPEGSFEIALEQKGTLGRYNVMQLEKDVVEFGNDEKGFFYSADYITSDKRTWVKYIEGKKVENGNQTESSDIEEKSYLTAMFTSGFFNEQYISLIETDPNDPSKHIFTLVMTKDVLRMINNGEKTFDNGSIKITFTMSGDRVTEIYSEIKLWSSVHSTNKITISNKCKFTEPIQNPSDVSGDIVA